VVSGNVSLYNETAGSPIQPTPMIGCVGVVDHIDRVTAATWNEGDVILVLGASENSLGGSEYLQRVHGVVGGPLPVLDLEAERNLNSLMVDLASSGLITGAHDANLGGLAVTLAELAISSGIGAVIEKYVDGRLDLLWFGESAGRVIASALPTNVDSIEQLARKHGVMVDRIGRATGNTLQLNDSAAVRVEELQSAFDSGFTRATSSVVMS
jgi:phosphoribosylformylglycinamidine synthase